MPNIEIKCSYPDLEKAKSIAHRLKAHHLGIEHQVDTYFKVSQGRLKLRQSTPGVTVLVPYLRQDELGPKKSLYTLLAAHEPELAKDLLSQLLGVDTVVEKVRDIFLIENVRVHLDQVKGLGKFLEFEAVYSDPLEEDREFQKVRQLIEEFEISEADLIQGSYRERQLGL